MLELSEWLKYVKNHRLKFKFEGLSGRSRGRESDFYQSVGDAATADEAFMDDFLYKDLESNTKYFKGVLESREDTDELLTRYYYYLIDEVSAREWQEYLPGIPVAEDPSLEFILKTLDAFNTPKRQEAFIENAIRTSPEDAWDMLRSSDECDYLLKDHPPVEVWSHAYDTGIPLEDVFFICPSCHGEPQTEENLVDMYGKHNGLPRFYCGSCGSEMQVGRQENILDFFNALEVTPYPFNEEKQKIWKELMRQRKALGENKLGVKIGDMVHLEASEIMISGADHWVSYTRAPGDLVRCTGIDAKSMSYEYPDGSHGGITWDHVWSKEEINIPEAP